MPVVKFLNEKQEIEVPEGSNLRKEALKAGVQVYPEFNKGLRNCQGLGACTTCKVYVKKGQENLSKPGLWERISMLGLFHPLALFARIGHEDEMRLSCQTKVMGDCEVETAPPLNWHGEKFWS